MNGRLDPHFHHPSFSRLVEHINSIGSNSLGSLIQFSKETWNKSDGRFTELFPYIEISGVGLGTNEYQVTQTSISEVPSRARQVVRTGDILVSMTRPHRGAVARVLPEDDGAIASTGFAIVRDVDSEQIDREYLRICLSVSFGCDQMLMRSSGGSYPAIIKDELSQVLIPHVSLKRQRQLVAAMEVAQYKRKAKLAEAEALTIELDSIVLDTLRISIPPQPRGTFAIRNRDLSGAMNAARYQGLQIERHIPFHGTVGNVASLVESKVSPSKDAPEQSFDWIRIDDLPNLPWEVATIRTEVGKNIPGSFFEVEENDILIARLGPTILNAKFVICPKLARRTVASTEFLVLRCNNEHKAEAIISVMRSTLYRNIMYLRTRGATPSRFRLSGDDLMSIPFPQWTQRYNRLSLMIPIQLDEAA